MCRQVGRFEDVNMDSWAVGSALRPYMPVPSGLLEHKVLIMQPGVPALAEEHWVNPCWQAYT